MKSAFMARAIMLFLAIQVAQAVHLTNLTQVDSVSNVTANATANTTTNQTSGNATKGHSLAVQGAKSGTKTMLELWDGVRAKTFSDKLKVIDEKFNVCFMQASTNTSMNAMYNNSNPKNATAKNATSQQEDGPKMATMCKKEKADLMMVHNEIKEELADYLDVVKTGSDVFSQQAIEKNGLKPTQMEPFTAASKLVAELQKAE